MRDPTGNFADRWFDYALQTAALRTLRHASIRTISPACFVATKLTAFADRGHGDFAASHDIEDLLAVVDGRRTLCAELASERKDLRQYVSESIADLLQRPSFVDTLPGHLPPDAASQARLPLLMERLKQIAALRAEA